MIEWMVSGSDGGTPLDQTEHPMPVPEPTRLPHAFIRWAGSKRLLLPELVQLVPASFASYYEPFLGGGSMFLRLRPESAHLNDALSPLVDAWRSVRDQPDELVALLESWDFTRERYDQLKSAALSTPLERGAQFLFLNRGAYGGLWRLNSSGRFNVPWSAPKTPSPVDIDNLNEVSRTLNAGNITITCGDFADVTTGAGADDLVFFDPPYSKGRAVRPFIHYNEKLFDWQQQLRLATEAKRLADIGATVIVTNSTHPDLLPLYDNFRRIDIVRHSSLGSRPNSSTTLAERIFVSH